MKIVEGNDLLYGIAGGFFEANEFLPNKKKDQYVRRGRRGLVDTFSVRLSKKADGTLWHHLTLDFIDAEVDRLFSSVEDQARHALGLEKISMKRATCSTTDWKSLYADTCAKQDGLWFTSLENIVRSPAPAEYEKMIEIGIKWFDKIHHFDALKDHCLDARTTHSFQICLTAVSIHSPKDLAVTFDRIVHDNVNYLGWEKSHVEAFYDALLQARHT